MASDREQKLYISVFLQLGSRAKREKHPESGAAKP